MQPTTQMMITEITTPRMMGVVKEFSGFTSFVTKPVPKGSNPMSHSTLEDGSVETK